MERPATAARSRRAGSSRASALVLIGATGDLGTSKLLPAVGELTDAGRLDVPVVGLGRSDHDDESFADLVARTIGGGAMSPQRSAYVRGDATDPATLDRLADRLDELVGADAAVTAVYAAMPPALLGPLGDAAADSRLAGRIRLVVDKPLGWDAESARDVHRRLRRAVADDELGVVDHYLAKSAVENATVVRAANPLFGHLLRAPHVERIEVDMLETDELDDRGSFYDDVGVVGDVLQNHVLQMLTLATMDPSLDGSADDEARIGRLRSIRTLEPDRCVLGQFEGYRSLDGVDDDSTTPTFVRAETTIDDERWDGVPVVIRAGKALDVRRAGITFVLRHDDAPAPTTDDPPAGDAPGSPHRIRFEVSPSPSIEIDAVAMSPQDHRLVATTLRLDEPCADEEDAYATVLAATVDGAHEHFAAIDGVVEAWRIVSSLAEHPPPLRRYAPGTSGPDLGAAASTT